MKVAIVGASDNPEKYANKAMRLLQEYKYEVIPVNPGKEEIEKIKTAKHINEITEKEIVLTLYLRPDKLEEMVDDMVKLHPICVIFNPGTESEKLMAILKKNNIRYVANCTLVLLKTGQFEKAVYGT